MKDGIKEKPSIILLVTQKIKSLNTKYKKGEQIVKEEQQRHKLLYLIKGSLKAYYINNDKRIIDWFAFESELFMCLE